MLGLGLVVGVMALLLAGTLYGLASYRATMRSIDSKLAELKEAGNLKDVTKSIVEATDSTKGTPDEKQLLTLIDRAAEALQAYEAKLEDTLNHHRDPDKGFTENNHVRVI